MASCTTPQATSVPSVQTSNLSENGIVFVFVDVMYTDMPVSVSSADVKLSEAQTCRGLSTRTRRERFQAQERNDAPWPRAQLPRLRLSVFVFVDVMYTDMPVSVSSADVKLSEAQT
jgi:hypothetical protein